jgi:hypothetical protein
MTETLTAVTLADIGYYSRDLDIGNFGWHRLLLPELDINNGHETSLGFFFFFFFNKRELGVCICW